MPEKISIVKESGETISSNIVSVFTIPDTEKKYIITTENAVDPHGLTVLHVSEILDGELKKVATDEEWSSIKTIMRAIISGNVGSYKYLPAMEVIKADGQYSRDISVSASASKQMIDNYNAADISAEAGDSKPAEGGDASIFPDGTPAPADDNEVMPGISEVDENAPAESAPAETPAEPAPAAEPAAPAEVPAPETQPVVPATPEPAPAEPAQPAAPAVPEAPATPAPVEAVPVAPTEPAPVAPAADVLNNEVQTPSIEPVAPVVPVAPAVPVTPVTVPVEPIQPQPVVVPAVPVETAAPVENVQTISVAPEINPLPPQEIATTATIAQPGPAAIPEQIQNIQVAQPTQVVPTAQIVQGVPEVNLAPPVEFNQNVTPSFRPDATVDEVVKASQDMFMEGVKNLVQTITEKVYRDLYIKEAEMKKREAQVAQKEQMLNTQFATMMSNITANFNGVPADPNATNNNPQG